ncbi:hypothetical protein CCM_02746 [Cordyceps militaris CM01]|uniref:GPI anchored serine-threonine rich n=1 Tax=Cordyceps militaris (strain CM01) TaxID=983644 RepID=G3JBG8_CORMM|nr:uncharacterized protein CCM_02746 [Cordyceps militaris CM01]EGX94475.1 hypothetical protein CCM_02746 [Cordyceps militaris CM01]
MHAFAVLSLVASTALVAAQQETYAKFQPLTSFGSPLEARQEQTCASLGGKPCGSKCIRITYTCCGNGQGACEVGYTCGLAANGIYGCCPFGKRCSGDAPEPTTSILGGSRPTTTVGSGSGGDDDEPTPVPTTRATPTSTRRLTAVTTSTPARTASGTAEDTLPSAVPTSGSDSGSGSGSSGNGSGSGSSSSSSRSSVSTAVSGGGSTGGAASSADNVGVSLAGLAGSFIAAVAAIL